MPYKRILAAVLGTGGIAFSNMLLALVIMQQGNLKTYGAFSFLVITQSLFNAVSNAILGTPLLISIGKLNESEQIKSFMFVNFLLSISIAFIQGVFAYSLLGSQTIATIYFLAAFFTTLRWFGRSYCNNSENHRDVVRSDAVYSVLCFILTGLCLYYSKANIQNIMSIVLFSMFFSLIALGGNYLKKQYYGILAFDYRLFVTSFKVRGKHSLTGVLTTEITTNIHSYLITLLFGAAAFAPIAAAMLLFRPLNLILSTLTQVERPRLRIMIRNEENQKAYESVNKLILFNIFILTLNVFFIFILLSYFPGLYWADFTTLNILVISTVVLGFINLMKSVRNPVSMYMQACDEFKKLSALVAIASLITCILVSLILLFSKIQFSLFGTLIGEIVLISLMFKFIYKAKLCQKIRN